MSSDRTIRVSSQKKMMETATSDLKESDDFGEAWESVFSQASSLLHQVNLQLTDYEDHFGSTRNWLRSRFEELQGLEKQLEARELKLKSDADAEAAAEAKDLENGKSHLNCVKLMIKENSEELRSKEKRLEEVERLVKEKEREYDLMQNRIKEATENLKRSKLIESKEDVENAIGKCEIILFGIDVIYILRR